jgi:hypothetical protein
MELARLHTAAMYAPEEPSSDEADTAWMHVDEIDGALKTTIRRTQRWRTRLRLSLPTFAPVEREREPVAAADDD